MTPLHLSTLDGHYAIIQNEDGRAYVAFGGTPWRRLTGQGHILAMARELSDIRAEIAETDGIILDQASICGKIDCFEVALADGSLIRQVEPGEVFLDHGLGRVERIRDGLFLTLATELYAARQALSILRETQSPEPTF